MTWACADTHRVVLLVLSSGALVWDSREVSVRQGMSSSLVMEGMNQSQEPAAIRRFLSIQAIKDKVYVVEARIGDFL